MNQNCYYCKDSETSIFGNTDVLEICDNGHKLHVDCWKELCLRKKILGGMMSTTCYICHQPIKNVLLEEFQSQVIEYTDFELSMAYDEYLERVANDDVFLHELTDIHKYVSTDVLIKIVEGGIQIPPDFNGWKWIFDYSNIQKVLNEVDRETMLNFLNTSTEEDLELFNPNHRENFYIRNILTNWLLDSLMCGFEENFKVIKRIVNEFYIDGIDKILIQELKKIVGGRSIVLDDAELFRNRDRYSKNFNIRLVRVIYLLEYFQSEISPKSFITITNFPDTGVFINWLFDNYLMQNRNVKAILFLIKNLPTMYLNNMDINQIHYLFQNHYNEMFKLFFPNLKKSSHLQNIKRSKKNEPKVDIELLESIQDEQKRDLIIDYFFERSQLFRDIDRHSSRPLPSNVIQHIREFGGYNKSFSY